jgi:hypothetical protein
MDLNKLPAEKLDIANSKPTIHMNGTSANQLYEDYEEALDSVREAIKMLEKASPNGRDYPQGDAAYTTAKKEHDARIAALVKICNELGAILEHVADHVK